MQKAGLTAGLFILTKMFLAARYCTVTGMATVPAP
jgi:hypothetical protein